MSGRCQPDKGVPAIHTARRIVAEPVDMAWLGPDTTPGTLPPHGPLGRPGTSLLMRFSVPLAPDAKLVEAYVVLHRVEVVDDDPSPISLHATRIIDVWNGRSTSAARAPRTEEVRASTTRVDPAGPALVRVDVRGLVERWRKRSADDQGLAIVAEGETETGMTFALHPSSVDVAPGPQRTPLRASVPGPYLELYVR